METPETTPDEVTPDEQQDDGEEAGGPAFDPRQAEGDDPEGDAQ